MADEPTSSPPRPARRTRRAAGAALIVWMLWLVGQLARDHTWLTGICFYIPSSVVAALGLGSAVVLAVRRRGRAALGAGLLAIPPVVAVGAVENQWRRPAPPPSHTESATARLVHWNIAYGKYDGGRLEPAILRQNADLYIFSETPRPFPLSDIAARLGTGFDSVRIGSMGFVARGRLLEPRRVINTKELEVDSVNWRTDHGTFKLFGVDITSSLRVARDPLLRELRALIVKHQPAIVAGDLNAPRRSSALWPLPPGFSHAYVAAGCGWSYTFPVPLPLYAIDQCIVSRAVTPLRYGLVSESCSDHLMQVLDYRAGAASK